MKVLKIKSFLRIFIFMPIFICLSSCEKNPYIESNSYDFSSLEQRITTYLESRTDTVDPTLEDTSEINQLYDGASIVLLKKGQGVIYKKFFGDHQDQQFFHFASTGKTVAASIFMALAEDISLNFSLSTPIDQYLNYEGPLQGRDITTDHLLSNTAGIPALIEGSIEKIIDSLVALPYYCQFFSNQSVSDCAQIIYNTRVLLDIFILQPPGKRFNYGGAQWYLATDVAEKVSGLPWKELVEKYLLEPCDIHDMAFGNPYVDLLFNSNNYPTFFNVDEIPYQDTPLIEGGLIATIDAYAKFLDMHLNDGMCGDNHVLNKASVENMRVSRVSEATLGIDFEETGYGLGWWVDNTTTGNSRYRFYDTGLFGAIAWIDTQREYAGVIVMENLNIIESGLGERPSKWYLQHVIPNIERILDNTH